MKPKRVVFSVCLVAVLLVLLTGCPGGVTGTWGGGKVTGLVASQGTYPHKIELSWNSVSGAAFYIISAARTEDGTYEQLSWGVPGTTTSLYLDDEYFSYYDIGLGQKMWFRVHAMVSTAGGLVYTELSDAAQGWSSQEIHDGTWVYQNESVTSSGGTETITGGTRQEIVIDATAKTIQYLAKQYNTGTEVYDTVSGAQFSFGEVRFPNEYNATIELIDLRQTHFWSTGSSAFETLTTASFTDTNGGVATGVVISIRLDTGMAVFEFTSDIDFDSDNDTVEDDWISSSMVFLRDLGLTE